MPKNKLSSLNKIMKKAARIIHDVKRQDRIPPILIDLHWLPIIARTEYKLNVLTYNALKSGKPTYLRKMLMYVNDQEQRTMEVRDSSKLVEPRYRKQVGQRSYYVSAPRMYNKIPEIIKNSENVNIFKKLKTFLFSKAYDLENKTNINYKLS